MKALKQSIIISLVFIGLSIQGCEDILKEDPNSLLAAENFLNTEEGVKQVLLGGYRHLANSTGNNRGEIGITEYCTAVSYTHLTLPTIYSV